MATHLVLGVTGALGFWCARLLLDRGESVVALARDPDTARRCFTDADSDRLRLIQGDALDAASVQGAAVGVQTIIHALNVRLSLWCDPVIGRQPLLQGSIDAAVEQGVRLLFPANTWVYGHTYVPFLFEGHPFAADTRKGRLAVALESMLARAQRERGLAYNVLRLPDVYGPMVCHGLYGALFDHVVHGKPLYWYGSLDTPLETVYAPDAARALLRIADDPDAPADPFNLPGVEETTARKWIAQVAEIAGVSGVGSHPLVIPSPFVAIAGWFNGEAHELHEMLYLKNRRLILSGDRYKQRYGELPATPYAEGIRETIAWHRARGRDELRIKNAK